MSKRKIHTLTDKRKEKIKANYDTLKLSDYDGEALRYLKNLKQLAKARKTKKAKVAKVDELEIPRDSEMYKIVEKAAKLKKMTVAKFIKKYRSSIEMLMKDGDFILQRETEYLIEDVNKLKPGKKVLVNDGNGFRMTAKKRDIFNIQQFTQHVNQHTDIFLIVYRTHYKLNGDISHYLPSVEEYADLEEAEDIEALLDEFYPEITYLKSGKKDAPAAPNVIEPKAKERKKTSNKGKPKQRPKRKKPH